MLPKFLALLVLNYLDSMEFSLSLLAFLIIVFKSLRPSTSR